MGLLWSAPAIQWVQIGEAQGKAIQQRGVLHWSLSPTLLRSTFSYPKMPPSTTDSHTTEHKCTWARQRWAFSLFECFGIRASQCVLRVSQEVCDEIPWFFKLLSRCKALLIWPGSGIKGDDLESFLPCPNLITTPQKYLSSANLAPSPIATSSIKSKAPCTW